MTDLHLLHTIASAIERGVPQHAQVSMRGDGEEYWGDVEMDASDAREIAREVLADLQAAGFRVTREEMATC